MLWVVVVLDDDDDDDGDDDGTNTAADVTGTELMLEVTEGPVVDADVTDVTVFVAESGKVTLEVTGTKLDMSAEKRECWAAVSVVLFGLTDGITVPGYNRAELVVGTSRREVSVGTDAGGMVAVLMGTGSKLHDMGKILEETCRGMDKGTALPEIGMEIPSGWP